MLELKDFYDDQIILRQVKRQAALEREEMEEDDMDDDEPVRSRVSTMKKQKRESSEMEADSPQTLPKEESVSRAASRRPVDTPDASEDEDS